MREVAAKAGVSAKTVSRVFNDDPHVLPATREHVERVMRELNYVPNVLATTFRAGRTSAVGIAVPDIADPFFAEIARAVDAVAQARGAATLISSLGEDPERERGILESLLSRQLTGLVVAPVHTDQAWLKRWKEHTPIVFVDRAPVGLTADTFTDDDQAGGRLATAHLIGHGHRRVAFLGDAGGLSTEVNRLAGYRQALAEAGIEPDDDLVVGGIHDRAAAEEALRRLSRLPDPPTAVFSSNARTSMKLMPFLSAAGVAVVGFGDFPMADVVRPALSVVDQDPTALGTLAAERVFDRQAHPGRRFRRSTALDVRLIERDSCAPAR